MTNDEKVRLEKRIEELETIIETIIETNPFVAWSFDLQKTLEEKCQKKKNVS